MTVKPVLYLLTAFLIFAGVVCCLDINSGFSLDYTPLRVAVAKDRDFINLQIKGPFRIEALNTGAVLEKGKYLRKY